MPGIKATRVDYGEKGPVKVGQSNAGGGKNDNKSDQRTGERSTGGLAGIERARAQKPVTGVVNADTVSTTASVKEGRPTTGGGVGKA